MNLKLRFKDPAGGPDFPRRESTHQDFLPGVESQSTQQTQLTLREPETVIGEASTAKHTAFEGREGDQVRGPTKHA
ncbi:MAG: hypothetical protein WC423_13060, partial [Vulcanimicrobiota bacterium]